MYCSDLVRAVDASEIIADWLGFDVLTMPGLRERDFGYFEGQLSTDVLAAAVDVPAPRPSTSR